MKTPTIEEIESYACETYGVTMEQVKEKKSRKAKSLIFYLTFRFTKLTSKEIAELYDSNMSNVNAAFDTIKFMVIFGNNEISRVVEGFEQAYIAR